MKSLLLIPVLPFWLLYLALFCVVTVLLFAAAHLLAPRQPCYLPAFLLLFFMTPGARGTAPGVGNAPGSGWAPALSPEPALGALLPDTDPDLSDDEQPAPALPRLPLANVDTAMPGLQVAAIAAATGLSTFLGLALLLKNRLRAFLGLPADPQRMRVSAEKEYVTRDEFEELKHDVEKLTNIINEHFRILDGKRSVSVANLHKDLTKLADTLHADMREIPGQVIAILKNTGAI